MPFVLCAILFVLLPFRCLSATPYSQANRSPAAPGGDPLSEGKKLRDSGHIDEAMKVFQSLAAKAQTENNPHLQSQALFALSGCEIRRFQYGRALTTLDHARHFAETYKEDNTLLGGIWGNVAVIYSQVGDFRAADLAGQRAVDYLKQSPRRDYFVMSLGNLGETQFGLNRVTEGRRSLEGAIAAAAHENIPSLEATYADDLGIWLVLNNDLNSAEPFLRQGLALRKQIGNQSQLAISYEHLAELEQKRGGPALADALLHIDTALHSRGPDMEHIPRYYPIHIRGLIYLGLGKPDLALADFKTAVDYADLWRQSALPGAATNIRTVAQLTAVYNDYVQLAAATSIKTADRRLAQEAFQVLAQNRAASLREQLTQTHRGKLLNSPEYFSLLTQLQSAQASVTLGSTKGKSEEDRKKLDQLRAELSDLENRLGLDQENQVSVSENNRHKNSLRSIQARLGAGEALLSYNLGDNHSYLWTLTKIDLKLYELPDRKTITTEAREFRDSVQSGRNQARRQSAGRALCQSLLGPIGQTVRQKSDWLIAADGDLLDRAIFSALPFGSDGAAASLIDSHSLRILPGALLSGSDQAAPSKKRFVGVGDPIYNRADTRWKTSALRGAAPSAKIIASLPGSRRELTGSSQASGMSEVELLTGADASSTAFRRATAVAPEIVHFAVHVLSPEGHPGEAALALSLNRDGLPELLTAESVATYRVPGSLVVLSGCASQQGEVIPGAGLVGLSRSWLVAGAEAVVVSAWPTPDDSGNFFSTFYSHFRQLAGPVPHRAAIALRLTQVDMQRSGTYRSDPAFWAAYSIISKQ